MNQIFNLEKALKVTDNDFDLLQEIIQMFKAEKMTMLNAIDDGLQTSNLELIKSSAHSIKGTLATIGAEICSELAFKIEKTESSESINSSKELFETLTLEIENYLNEAIEKLRTVKK